MRRQPWFRAVATLLALWFPLIAGEPGLLHPCPMHGAGAAVAAALLGHAPAAGEPAAHAEHAAHAAHSAHSAPSAHSAHRDGAPSHEHHDCTCINGCCVSMAAVSPPLPPTIEIAEVAIRAASTVPNVPSLARPAPEFSRPWTTGPPRA